MCAICRAWGRQRICESCLGRFDRQANRCRHCALEVPTGSLVCGACLIEPPPYVAAVAAVDYDHPWDGLITHFKFHAALDLAPALAERLSAAVRRTGLPLPSLLLPVPLSVQRLRERGYNQAWELAQRIATPLRCQADARLLLRVKDTPHQLTLPLDKRAANVRGAFAVDTKRGHELRGREIALIDDVMTTGATAAEAANTLLKAGAAAVQVWVVGRTARAMAH